LTIAHRRTALICFLALLCTVQAASAQAPDRPHDAASLLACIDRAMAAWQDYRVNGESEAKGKRERFKVYFKCPNLVRVDAHDGQVAVQPDGTIRGRLGHGLFGGISRGLSRTDKRLQDDEGTPFYESHFPALIARIRQQVKQGMAAVMDDQPAGYGLEIRSDKTTWKYRFDKSTYAVIDASRWVDGRQIAATHYTDFKANTGLTTRFFKF
jgi:outer membrane lipoprotein-sorting protein